MALYEQGSYNSYNDKAQYYIDWVLAFIGEDPDEYGYDATEEFVERHKGFFDKLFAEVEKQGDAFDVHAFCVNEITLGNEFGWEE